MAKKRKGGGRAPGSEDADAGALPKVPGRLASPFKGALAGLKKQLEEQAKEAERKQLEAKQKRLAPPPPSAVRPTTRKQRASADEDATALSLAMVGVKPLAQQRPPRVAATTPRLESRTAKVAPFGRSAEDEARARLDELVAQDVSFRIETEREYVRGARVGAPPRSLRELARRTHVSETLDLHGMHQREAHEAVVSFVRRCHRLGLSVVCVVHGKGQHSEGGLGVLRDVVVRSLTDSGAATLVNAFVTAPEPLGGSGALLIELKH
jgi:DNA-nicking Smr family endonuclease